MSSHKIGFYEEISKIITYLYSNIIKYAPYFFCWHYSREMPPKEAEGMANCADPSVKKKKLLEPDLSLGFLAVRHKQGCTATEDG